MPACNPTSSLPSIISDLLRTLFGISRSAHFVRSCILVADAYLAVYCLEEPSRIRNLRHSLCLISTKNAIDDACSSRLQYAAECLPAESLVEDYLAAASLKRNWMASRSMPVCFDRDKMHLKIERKPDREPDIDKWLLKSLSFALNYLELIWFEFANSTNRCFHCRAYGSKTAIRSWQRSISNSTESVRSVRRSVRRSTDLQSDVF